MPLRHSTPKRVGGDPWGVELVESSGLLLELHLNALAAPGLLLFPSLSPAPSSLVLPPISLRAQPSAHSHPRAPPAVLPLPCCLPLLLGPQGAPSSGLGQASARTASLPGLFLPPCDASLAP